MQFFGLIVAGELTLYASALDAECAYWKLIEDEGVVAIFHIPTGWSLPTPDGWGWE